jgi:RND family efflux transporter MFP subunit
MTNISKFFIITGVISLFAFYACSKKSETKPNEEQKKLPLVKVIEIKPSDFTDDFKVVGIVKPVATAKLSSEEGGLIYSVLDKGSRVSRGSIVVRLNKEVDKATYEQLEAQYELAKMNFEKQDLLWKQNATTEIQWQTAKWQMEAAGRALDVLRTRLKKQYVRSPINGIIDEKYMNKGEMSAPGVPILNIVDVSSVKITAGVPERYINNIKKGQEITVTVDILPGSEFTGKINYISPGLSSTSRTIEIEVVINNRDRLLKPEMNANVLISKNKVTDAVVIPQDLIVDYGEEKYVFILEGDTAKKRLVELDGRNGNMVLVVSGLNIGEKLISEGFQSLAEGDKVQIGN